MRIEPFDLERWQSIHEHAVEINLSESGVRPLRVRELIEPLDLDRLLNQELAYTQTNGTEALRAQIATLYEGANSSQVLVTNGSSEANFVCCWRLIETGDEVVSIQPNYMQIPGLARAFGATVREVWLDPGERRWTLDLAAVRTAVTDRTRLIVICNPNNPTGSRLTEEDVGELCALADERGCWLLADEVYRGAELDGREAASAWGRHDRVIVTGGLSKVYGLPGLRLGWAAAPKKFIDELWGRRDYTSIAPGAISDLLARTALEPSRRNQLLERARRILRENQSAVASWVAEQPGVHQVPPEAGGVTLIRYAGTRRSSELAEALRTQHGLLIVPGAHFKLESHLRLGIGGEPAPLTQGLKRLGSVLAPQLGRSL